MNQPDGKILANGGFGFYNGVWATGIVRLNPDGSLDQSFQVGGNDSFAAPLNSAGLALLPDGDLIASLRSNISFIKNEPVQYHSVVRLHGDPRTKGEK
ncbi:MAG TPA: delta-60 repeat domain-containing protein [Verrucomicrobiae bacterium]|nr:delta-60 repeat domain-containing protein [Verrucomicrobiae bacterium]